MNCPRTVLGILVILVLAVACSPPPSNEASEFRQRVISDVEELAPSVLQVLPSPSPNPVSKLLTDFFSARPERAELFAGVVVFDAEGQVICAYSPIEDATRIKGNDFSNYEAVKQTLKKHTASNMVLYYLSDGRRITLPAVNLPLTDNGRFLGILTVFFLKTTLEEGYRISLEEFERLDFNEPWGA